MCRSGEKILGQFGFIPSKGNGSTDKEKALSENLIYFYRGVSEPSDKNFLIEPSVSRGEDEWDLYHYILQYHSEEFISMRPMEIMTKMQHLEVPTRLLDITRNPLVAAFFSVSGFYKFDAKAEQQREKNKSTIIEFELDKQNIKRFDSDTIKMLSCLPLLKEDYKKQLLEQLFVSLVVMGYIKKISEEYRKIFTDNIEDMTLSGHDNDASNSIIKSFEENMFRIVMCFANGNFKKEYFKFKKIEGLNEIEKKLQEKYSNVNLQFCKVDVDFNSIIRGGFFYIYVCLIDEGSQLDIFFVHNDKSEDLEHNKCSFRKKPIRDCCYSYVERVEKSNKPILLQNLVSKGIECRDQFNEYIDWSELDWQIQCSYPQWYNKYEHPIDLLNGVFVNPRVNTDRMRVQQGSFMMFGLSRYWNIEKCIEYLSDIGCDIDEIYSFIVENKPIFSDGNKCDLFKSYDIDVKEFENCVFNARRYKIRKRKKKDNIIDNLNISGVNKQSLGCSMQTTYFQYRMDKDRAGITKE